MPFPQQRFIPRVPKGMSGGKKFFLFIIMITIIGSIAGYFYWKSVTDKRKKIAEEKVAAAKIAAAVKAAEEEKLKYSAVITEKVNPMTDSGGGNNVYLDQQPVKCGDNSVLSSLKLVNSDDKTKWQYKYSCQKNDNVEYEVIDKETEPTDNGGGAAIFLDRQEPTCDGGIISDIQLLRPTPTTNHYKYKCLKPKNMGINVSEWKFTENVAESNDTRELIGNMEAMKCESSDGKPTGISQFRLSRNGTGIMRYGYKCGTVTTTEEGFTNVENTPEADDKDFDVTTNDFDMY